MADKNVQMKVLNSSGSYDSINPKSNASLITTSDGNNVQNFIDSKGQPNGIATLDANKQLVQDAKTLNGHGTDNGPNSVLLSGRKSGTTIGTHSTAEGFQTEASGFSSHAEGYYTTASGENSHAEGDHTQASNYSSHAEGDYTQASGGYSHAEGDHATASGSYSHAEGSSTTASGNSSHAEGLSTTAIGLYSHAEGGHTQASDSYSHAEGSNTTASGGGSHAEGYGTTASGNDSHAEGHGTTASSLYSHAEGSNTTANVCNSHVQGFYNKALAGDPSAYDATADAMVIGNGSSDALSNCFRITFGGNVYGLSSYHSSGADYSEFFEWQDENPSAEDRVGHFVTLDGEKIRYANDGDYIVGITSGNPAVIGDHPSESWKERYLRDVFGRLQYEDVVIPETQEKDKDGNVIRTIPEHTETHFKVNPDYDPAKEAEYANREKRPEWATVGMLGKLVVIDDGTCEVNGYCKPKNGTATKSDTGYRVLARLDETHIKVLIK